MNPEIEWLTTPRKISHAEARAEQRIYWSSRSVAERLAASAELTMRMKQMREGTREERDDEQKADCTARRIRRG